MVRKKVRTKSVLFTIGNTTILVRVKNQLLRGLRCVFRLSKYEYYYEKIEVRKETAQENRLIYHWQFGTQAKLDNTRFMVFPLLI